MWGRFDALLSCPYFWSCRELYVTEPRTNFEGVYENFAEAPPGTAEFGGRDLAERLHFHRTFEELPSSLKFDVAFFSSSFQYFKNPEDVIRHVIQFARPDYFLFTCTPMVIGRPSFASIQTVHFPLVSPVWFTGYTSLCEIMRRAGYQLLFVSSLFNDNKPVAEHFPYEYQSTKRAHLLFRKKKKPSFWRRLFWRDE